MPIPFTSYPYTQYLALIAGLAIVPLVVVVSLASCSYVYKRFVQALSNTQARTGVKREMRWAAGTGHLTIVIAVTGTIAFLIGALAGNSRNPISESVIVAVMGVFSGLVASMLNHEAKNRVLAAVAATNFCIVAVYGVHVGSLNRVKVEQEARYYDEQLLRYKSQLSIEEYRQKQQAKLATDWIRARSVDSSAQEIAGHARRVH